MAAVKAHAIGRECHGEEAASSKRRQDRVAALVDLNREVVLELRDDQRTEGDRRRVLAVRGVSKVIDSGSLTCPLLTRPKYSVQEVISRLPPPHRESA